ncbi:putative reverse transcriptase domain-containing protein [Tanacetum coccineum]
MAPKKRTAVITTTSTPMTDAQIKALIARGIADALAERDTDRSRNGNDSHDSRTDRKRQVSTVCKCTYTDFLKYQPMNFKSTKGVVGLTQWTVKHDVSYAMPWKTLKKMMTDKYRPRGEIKKLETEMWNLKVKGTDVLSYNQHFQELALMCDRMFPEESDEVEKYVGGLPDMIHGSVKASKPKTMQEAIEFASYILRQESVGTSTGRVILFGTIPTTIPDTTASAIPPTTHIDTTPIPTISPTIPPSPDYTPTSPDYTPASPDYSPASDME